MSTTMIDTDAFARRCSMGNDNHDNDERPPQTEIFVGAPYTSGVIPLKGNDDDDDDGDEPKSTRINKHRSCGYSSDDTLSSVGSNDDDDDDKYGYGLGYGGEAVHRDEDVRKYGYGDDDAAKYGYSAPAKTDQDKYGYGDAAPSTTADEYGYGDAAPATATDEYGYGDAAPAADECGYGDATPATSAADEYGYGDSAPPATDYGYGDQEPPPPAQTPQRRRDRPRRRGSVTKFSLDTATEVADEFNRNDRMLRQQQQQQDARLMPPPPPVVVSMDDDSVKGGMMSVASEDNMSLDEGRVKPKRKKSGRLSRFRIGRNSSTSSTISMKEK